MTVQKVFVKNIYKGNGSNKTFPITFEWPTAHPEYIKVYVKDDTGAMVAVTDFSVSQSGEAWNVTYPLIGEALAEGSTLVVTREIPLVQILNLVNLGPYFAEDVEVTFDEIVMMIQQLNEAAGRSVKFALDLSDEFDPTLPIQPGYGWRVSDDGKSIVPVKDSEIILHETERVYGEAIRDTERIKEETEAIRNQTQAISDVTAGYMNTAEQHKDDAEQASENADNSASLAERWAQAIDSPDNGEGNKSSKSWAEIAMGCAIDAGAQADRAMAYAAEARIYDPSVTYQPGQVVMTADGVTYRCISVSTGENPVDSNKWVMVTIVVSDTFELDENGDLTPLLNPKTSEHFEIDENGDIMPGL